MKTIIIKSEDTIELSKINNSSIIGIQWGDGSKAIVLNTDNGFCSLSNSHKPSLLNVWYSDSAQEYVDRALNRNTYSISKAFVFDTASELFEWMSKQ